MILIQAKFMPFSRNFVINLATKTTSMNHLSKGTKTVSISEKNFPSMETISVLSGIIEGLFIMDNLWVERRTVMAFKSTWTIGAILFGEEPF